MRAEPLTWWFVGLVGHWRLARPAHAYPLVSESDATYRRQGYRWWQVPILEFRGDEARVDFGTGEVIPATRSPVHFDPAEAYRIDSFDGERAAMLAEFARADSLAHPFPGMRALYARCAMWLDGEASRLARVADPPPPPERDLSPVYSPGLA